MSPRPVDPAGADVTTPRNTAAAPTSARPPALTARLDAGIRRLTPGYFALVMATGIVSIGMGGLGMTAISVVLLVIATIAYVVLVALNVLRFVRHREATADDFRDPGRAFGFFTFVAASDVLGSRIASEGIQTLALSLLLVGALAWLVLGYVVPWTAALRQHDPPALRSANGTWFIWAVASQSVAVLAATLQRQVSAQWAHDLLALVAVFCWAIGIFLYCAVAVFVGVRMLSRPFLPADFTPPYWVAMGATAITVVAASRIVQMEHAPMVDATRGLIGGTAVFFWAFGTWLIPPLIAAGYWRHIRHRVPLRYEATLWSIVFPIGMYGVGSQLLGEVDQLPIVLAIGRIDAWIALAVWAITFGAMIVAIVRLVRGDVRHRDG